MEDGNISVALGWMILLWMALFAGVIFGDGLKAYGLPEVWDKALQ